MTNKTERYFVCSESELRRLGDAAYQLGYEEARTHGAPNESFPAADKKAEAACRAREVVLTNVGFDTAWVEVEK